MSTVLTLRVLTDESTIKWTQFILRLPGLVSQPEEIADKDASKQY
jgi:hypothetical protein